MAVIASLRRSITLAVVFAVLPAFAGAQSPGPGERVRLVRRGENMIVLEGRLARATPDSVWITSAGTADTTRAALGTGLRLDRSLGRRSHALTGALVGAGAGTAAALLFYSGFCSDPDTLCDGDEELRIAAVFIIPSTLVGAGIGALIRTERWQPVVMARPQGGLGLGVGFSF